MFKPTDEQASAADAFRTGGNLVLEAGAGTGKTSTLKLLARTAPMRRGVYFAFNKAIATEASASFPGTVECRTLHSFAYRAVVNGPIQNRLRAPRQRGWEVAKHLGINGPHRVSDTIVLAPQQTARLVLDTVTRFCQSGHETIGRSHVPVRPGMEDPAVRSAVTALIEPYARKAWKDIAADNGWLRYTHDYYLKLYALRHPIFPVDYLLVDEAQDSNGLTIALVKDQESAGKQIVVVGDENQGIYAWRGSESAMSRFEGERRSLSQSFRFGPAIATEANKWLTLLRSELRLRGDSTIMSRLDDLDGPTNTGERAPDAILCRTNATAVRTLLDLLDRGIKAAVVGGGDEVRRLAEAAQQLQEKGQTWHPELCAFTSWAQVQDYAENDAGGDDLAVAVRLIDSWGADRIIDAIDSMARENQAEVTISTAHKAKGREWDRVRIADDFNPPKPNEDGTRGAVPRDVGMLAYVAVTRAQKVLDRGSLSWVEEYLPRAGVSA